MAARTRAGAVIWCFLATLVTVRAPDGINTRPSAVDKRPKYQVQLLTGAMRHPPVGWRQVEMTKHNGKLYRCHLPPLDHAEVKDDPTNLPPPPPLAGYLEQISGGCFYRLEGWWTYEFCVNKHVRQFRQESGKSPATAESETPEYSLGHVTPARSANLAYVPTLQLKA